MFFFRKKNSEAMSDKNSLASSQFFSDCMILDSVIDASIQSTEKKITEKAKKLDDLLQSVEELKEDISDNRKRVKLLKKRKEEISVALESGDKVSFSSEELFAIQKKKAEISEIEAYISVNGKNKLQVTKDIVFGRSNECDVPVADTAVSRIHAKLMKKADGFWLKDLGSTNGTFVDEVKLNSETAFKLDKPAIITIGRTKVFFAFASPD